MPKRAAAAETYESDDGFVEDAPSSSKTKNKKMKFGKVEKEDQDKAQRIEAEGDQTSWELSKNRRVAIAEFKGKFNVDVREFYEKDGEKLPGKKGIQLTAEQFQNFLDALPDLLVGLEAKGVQLRRPDLTKGSKAKKEAVKAESNDEEDEEDDGDEDD